MSCCGVFIMPYEATQPTAVRSREARPITGRFVLITFIAFFGVIAAVNGIMMTLAIRTMPGLEVKNGYVASQAMNGQIDAMRLQAERGWKADVSVRLKDKMAPVSVSLLDRDGRPITGLAVTGRLAHPALTRADHTAALVEARPGVYSAAFTDVTAGGWTLVVEANRGHERVFSSRNRIVLTESTR
jgi:nitrogen fixation protein FixH